jgi:hypothetical protein
MKPYVRRRVDPVPRFWAKVDKGPGLFDCWLWTGGQNGAGYGQFHMDGGDGRRQRYAHRLAYEWLVGPIPDGMTLDHLCRTPRCVRPDHLEVVTMGVNVLRGNGLSAKRARQTTCKAGHPFDRLVTDADGHIHRLCTICQRANRARYYREHVA